jgi:hypothetical protein
VSSFDKQEYAPTDSGILTISVCSRGLSPTNINITPPVITPNITFLVPPNLGAITLPSAGGTVNACVDYSYPFTVNSVGNISVKYEGTFECEGEEYSINSGTGLAFSSDAVFSCSAMTTVVKKPGVVSALFPTAILSINIKNTGTSLLTNVDLASYTLPAGAYFATQTFPSNIALLPGDIYTYEQTLTFDTNNDTVIPDVYTILIPQGKVTGICRGNIISLNDVMFVTITVPPMSV